MYERFTDRARRAVVLTEEVCRAAGASAMSSAHLLAALGNEDVGGVAYEVLAGCGFQPAAAELNVPGIAALAGRPSYSGECKKVLEYALREALQLGHTWIGTEHLLLSIIRCTESAGFAELEAQCGSPDKVRAAVIEKLSGYNDAAKVREAERACVTRGGHCWEAKPRSPVRVGGETKHYETCKHCTAQRVGTTREGVEWTYPEGQP